MRIQVSWIGQGYCFGRGILADKNKILQDPLIDYSSIMSPKVMELNPETYANNLSLSIFVTSISGSHDVALRT
jgi:hypothetical protein